MRRWQPPTDASGGMANLGQQRVIAEKSRLDWRATELTGKQAGQLPAKAAL